MNNQNNSSVPSEEQLADLAAFTDGSIRDFPDFRDDVERLSETQHKGTLKALRKSIYDTIDARVRNAVKAALATQPAEDRVQGGLTEREIKELWHRNFRSEFDGDSIGFAEDIFRAILSRQSMMGSEVWGGCPDLTDDMLPPDLMQRNVRAQIARRAAAPQEQVERPSHETIISEGGKLVCTACGTTTPANAAAANGDSQSGSLWREGVLMAASVLTSVHDHPTMAADMLNELGLRDADCSGMDDFDKANLRKVLASRPALKLRGLEDSSPAADADGQKGEAA